mgnify:CR=1 FL=1
MALLHNLRREILYTANKNRARVHLETVMVEHFGVGGLLSADKNHHIVAACKVLQTLHAVGDIAANGIVVFEDDFLAYRLFASSPSRLFAS